MLIRPDTGPDISLLFSVACGEATPEDPSTSESGPYYTRRLARDSASYAARLPNGWLVETLSSLSWVTDDFGRLKPIQVDTIFLDRFSPETGQRLGSLSLFVLKNGVLPVTFRDGINQGNAQEFLDHCIDDITAWLGATASDKSTAEP